MNIIKKTYCRIFQFCFKMAIPILPYYNPKILDKVEDISTVLNSKKINRVMLITDKSIKQLGITEKLENNLKENNIYTVVFDDVVSNPTVENVENARKLYLKTNYTMGRDWEKGQTYFIWGFPGGASGKKKKKKKTRLPMQET